MLDSKHVNMAWTGRPRQMSHVVTSDVRRRVYTPSLTYAKPLVMRPSLEATPISKSRTIPVKRNSSAQMEHQLYRAHSFRDVIVRDSVPRKPTMPAATKLTHQPEIKPILKRGKGTYILKATETTSSVASNSKPSSGTDGKFCYKLPERPSVKLRKTVSFKEDRIASARNTYTRQLSSPMLSIPNGVHDEYDGRQIYV